jgi:hypothetical protein
MTAETGPVGNIVGSTLAYSNIGCLNMDHRLIINDCCLSFVLFCFMFDCFMFCNRNSLYEHDDRNPQCGQLSSRTKDIKE